MGMYAQGLNFNSMPEVVAEHIKKAICAGVYSAGDRLKELELVSELDVSRGTIREALILLHENYWVENVPRKGCFVLMPTFAEGVAAFKLLKSVLKIAIENVKLELISTQDLKNSWLLESELQLDSQQTRDALVNLYSSVIKASDCELTVNTAKPSLSVIQRLPKHFIRLEDSSIKRCEDSIKSLLDDLINRNPSNLNYQIQSMLYEHEISLRDQ